MFSRTASLLLPGFVLTLTATVASNIALAQKPADASAVGSLSEVTVISSRENPKPTVSTTGWPRVPVTHVTLGYAVSIIGYDLTSSAGVADLEKAVNETAMDVCKEIGRQYPGSTPDDAGCAKVAAAKAMVKVHQLVATAQKNAAK